LDGRYHPLQVTLRNSRGLTVEARHGYYAPRYADSPAEQAKKANRKKPSFPPRKSAGCPVTVETQFFKSGSDEATVDVLAKVDVKQLQFQKENGRNRNDVTVVTGLFDRDGKLSARNPEDPGTAPQGRDPRNAPGRRHCRRTSFDVKTGQLFRAHRGAGFRRTIPRRPERRLGNSLRHGP